MQRRLARNIPIQLLPSPERAKQPTNRRSFRSKGHTSLKAALHANSDVQELEVFYKPPRYPKQNCHSRSCSYCVSNTRNCSNSPHPPMSHSEPSTDYEEDQYPEFEVHNGSCNPSQHISKPTGLPPKHFSRNARPVIPSHLGQTTGQFVDKENVTSRTVTSRTIPVMHLSPSREHVKAGGNFSTPKNTMNTTQAYNQRTWGLRTSQTPEPEGTFKRVTSVSGSPGQSNYSAHRERLRREREERQRRMAASSTGLNEQHLHQQRLHSHQQDHRYRSMSAVNHALGTSEACEEIETITLQPIGRGVQEIDSRTGSLATLNQVPRGGSLIDGMNRVDGGIGRQTNDLGRRGFSSTQYLDRRTPTPSLTKQKPVHRSQMLQENKHLSQQQRKQSVGYTSSSTMYQQAPQMQFVNSRPTISHASSTTMVPISTVPAALPVTITYNGSAYKKTQSYRQGGNDALATLQNTAHLWYRPDLTREEAIRILREKPPGSFLIRKSTTYVDSYGLAVKVAQLPPKITQKSSFTKILRKLFNDLQSELVRHYLIEVVRSPSRGVRLRGFASEPVFPSLADLIHRHTIEQLALSCRLLLPSIPSDMMTHRTAAQTQLPSIVIGSTAQFDTDLSPTDYASGLENGTTESSVSGFAGISPDIAFTNTEMIMTSNQTSGRESELPVQNGPTPLTPISSYVQNESLSPFSAGLPNSPKPAVVENGQQPGYHCFMLGYVDSPQWNPDICLTNAVDQLIPFDHLNAADCDQGISPVRYTDVTLTIDAQDGVRITDLSQRMLLRRHIGGDLILYSNLDPRQKEFIHPHHKESGVIHPKIFVLVVRKGMSQCTTYVFSELNPSNPAEAIVRDIRMAFRL